MLSTHVVHVGEEIEVEELVFLIEVAPEGGFIGRALGQPIFTEADDRESLKRSILDAVACHYEPGQGPKLLRLHFVEDKVVPV